ncbi:putative dual-specificity RNA methyltransferase RlmN, partial [Mycobacterium marinum]
RRRRVAGAWAIGAGPADSWPPKAGSCSVGDWGWACGQLAAEGG